MVVHHLAGILFPGTFLAWSFLPSGRLSAPFSHTVWEPFTICNKARACFCTYSPLRPFGEGITGIMICNIAKLCPVWHWNTQPIWYNRDFNGYWLMNMLEWWNLWCWSRQEKRQTAGGNLSPQDQVTCSHFTAKSSPATSELRIDMLDLNSLHKTIGFIRSL